MASNQPVQPPRPRWLDNAHKALHAAVAAAYGWGDYNPDMPEDEILARLLALNKARVLLGKVYRAGISVA
ncbi:MAG: hypothetical protein U9Q81_22330 [Pseudomonadota bacterium]|nr:hypothetical protein [Pseudomonadota bacterium]